MHSSGEKREIPFLLLLLFGGALGYLFSQAPVDLPASVQSTGFSGTVVQALVPWIPEAGNHFLPKQASDAGIKFCTTGCFTCAIHHSSLSEVRFLQVNSERNGFPPDPDPHFYYHYFSSGNRDFPDLC